MCCRLLHLNDITFGQVLPDDLSLLAALSYVFCGCVDDDCACDGACGLRTMWRVVIVVQELGPEQCGSDGRYPGGCDGVGSVDVRCRRHCRCCWVCGVGAMSGVDVVGVCLCVSGFWI